VVTLLFKLPEHRYELKLLSQRRAARYMGTQHP